MRDLGSPCDGLPSTSIFADLTIVAVVVRAAGLGSWYVVIFMLFDTLISLVQFLYEMFVCNQSSSTGPDPILNMFAW